MKHILNGAQQNEDAKNGGDEEDATQDEEWEKLIEEFDSNGDG